MFLKVSLKLHAKPVLYIHISTLDNYTCVYIHDNMNIYTHMHYTYTDTHTHFPVFFDDGDDGDDC